jgi:DNA adenine methylase
MLLEVVTTNSGDNMHNPAKPVIKWAGGKTYLLEMIEQILSGLDTTKYRYFEPMVGGGAVFFRHANKFKSAGVSDLNPDLINLYRVIKSDVDALIKELTNGEYFYTHKSDPGTLDNYRKIRASDPESSVCKAARIMFLLKTCFNGLMRVNKSGRFNVPPGSYTNPQICNEEALRAASAAFANTTIEGPGDATTLIQALSGKQHFLFLDPPYHGGKFTGYSGEFGDEHQIALVEATLESGCPFIYTNRATKLILSLFKDSDTTLDIINLRHSIQPKYTTNVVEKELVAYRL